MLYTSLLVAGSVAYVAIKSLPLDSIRLRMRQHRRDGASVLAFAVAGPARGETPSVEVVNDRFAVGAGMSDRVQMVGRRYRVAAATSVCLAAGGLAFPVLNLASIPLTVYSMTPILEYGARAALVEKQLKPSVLNSVVIVSFLVTDRYLSAAALTWLHHSFRHIGIQFQEVFQSTVSEVISESGNLAAQALGSSPRTVWTVQENVEVQIPFAQLQAGDVVVVSRGEFIPVDGVITAGKATVNPLLRSGTSTSLAVSVGDRVYARTLVTEGRIRVQIEQITQ